MLIFPTPSFYRRPESVQDIFLHHLHVISSTFPSFFPEDAWTSAIEAYLHPRDYVKLSSIRMCAMELAVFIRRLHLPRVCGLMTSYTRTGFKGLLGNKGGVSARFSLGGVDLAFVGAHLSPHLHNAEERITDFAAILYSQEFYVDAMGKAKKSEENEDVEGPLHHHQAIPLIDHDYVFFCGDLNFRLDHLSREEIISKIQSNDLASLLEHDQLSIAMREEKIFAGFREMPIDFAPTYKFDQGTDDYDTSAKRRKPAWCDRVLWRSKLDEGGRGEYDGEGGCGNVVEEDKGNVRVVEKAMEKLEKGGGTASISSPYFAAESYVSGKEYVISDHKPVCFTASLKTLHDPSLTVDSSVHFPVVVDWKKGRDCVARFSIDGDEIVDRWSWIGIYKPDFKSLADFVTWNYATSAVVDGKRDEGDAVTKTTKTITTSIGKRLFALTYYAKYVTDSGPHLLIYVSKNCVMGMSDVFVIE